ncbi:hypothetical protein RAA17_00605 [Komagataeibacter rhaeticus]|nr:hypothetical protein [Komagataeibacter rhaeticus]
MLHLLGAVEGRSRWVASTKAVTYSTMPAVSDGSIIFTSPTWSGKVDRSNWSTPAPREKTSLRLGNRVNRSGSGRHMAMYSTSAGSP